MYQARWRVLVSMKRLHKNSLASQVLKVLATTGLILVAASSPFFALDLIRGLKRYRDKEKWKKFYYSLNYLDRRGYVKLTEKENGVLEAKLTRQGEVMIERINFSELKLSEPGKWDGKWRLVIFDVPTRKHKNRRAFAEKLKELGFIMVQKSVWAYPFECYKELAIVRKFYEVEKFVTYLEAVEIEDELAWRGKFNLGPGARLA